MDEQSGLFAMSFDVQKNVLSFLDSRTERVGLALVSRSARDTVEMYYKDALTKITTSHNVDDTFHDRVGENASAKLWRMGADASRPLPWRYLYLVALSTHLYEFGAHEHPFRYRTLFSSSMRQESILQMRNNGRIIHVIDLRTGNLIARFEIPEDNVDTMSERQQLPDIILAEWLGKTHFVCVTEKCIILWSHGGGHVDWGVVERIYWTGPVHRCFMLNGFKIAIGFRGRAFLKILDLLTADEREIFLPEHHSHLYITNIVARENKWVLVVSMDTFRATSVFVYDTTTYNRMSVFESTLFCLVPSKDALAGIFGCGDEGTLEEVRFLRISDGGQISVERSLCLPRPIGRNFVAKSLYRGHMYIQEYELVQWPCRHFRHATRRVIIYNLKSNQVERSLEFALDAKRRCTNDSLSGFWMAVGERENELSMPCPQDARKRRVFVFFET